MTKTSEKPECRQKAVEPYAEAYALVDEGKIGKIFSLQNHKPGSVGSIGGNTAEGFEWGGNKTFIQFLFMEKGCSGELPSQFHRSKRGMLVEDNVVTQFYKDCRTTSVKLSNFIKRLKNSDFKGIKYETGYQFEPFEPSNF